MMTNHISTGQAKSRGLPGSDVFRFSHLLYNDSLHRDAGVLHLNVEAYKAFSDTILISKRHIMEGEERVVEEWCLANKGSVPSSPYPWPRMTLEYIKYVNYENFKIASGFELHLKARLLSRDFVVHEIDNQNPSYKLLAKEQKTRPISKSELFSIASYHFDGKQNYLPGLKDSSLSFSKLTDKSEYRKLLDLSDAHLDIIKDYRNLRNQIHLPGDIIESPSIQNHQGQITDFIINFVNREIVRYSNSLIEKHQFNHVLLAPLL